MKKTIAVETQETLVQRTMQAITTRAEQLNTQKTNALSAFRTTANQLAEINKGLTATAKVSDEMISFLGEYKVNTEKEIADNAAVMQRILDIIGD